MPALSVCHPLARASCAVLVLAFHAPVAAQVISAPTDPTHGRAPTASGLHITLTDANGDAAADVGETLNAQYQFADLDGDTQDEARSRGTIKWRRNGAVIPGEVGLTYILKTEDIGTQISFEFEPWTDPAITVPASGITYDSVTHNNGSGPGTIDPQPGGGVLMAVTIDGLIGGRPIVDGVLTARVTCSGGGSCGTIDYAWERQLNGGGWVPVGTNSVNYTPVRGDQLYNIRVKATRTGP